MLLTREHVSNLARRAQHWDSADFELWWEGVLFLPGTRIGRESIIRLEDLLRTSGVAAVSAALMGSYFVIIRDKAAASYYAFTDKSGCYEAFHSSDAISSSFLDIIRGYTAKQLDEEAVVEFFNFGDIHLDRTFFTSCKKLAADVILAYAPASNSIEQLPKPIKNLDNASDLPDFIETFGQIAESLRGERISADLTGGIDSRLVTTLLRRHGLEFETTNTGPSWAEDCEIPRLVASVLGVPFYRTEHHLDHLEEDVGDLFEYCDGLTNVFRNHLVREHNLARVRRGATVAITGGGGELYKDFWWLQDFPLYRRRKSNVERLFDLRILPIPFRSDLLAGVYREINERLRSRMVEALAGFELPINTQTYDNIYYNFRMRSFGRRFLTTYNRVIPSYAPLLELELVRYGFHLPRRKRFFNRFHRELMTRLNPAVARMRTTEGGMSVSAEPGRILRDLPRYGLNRATRLTRKVSQRVLARTMLKETSPNAPEFLQRIRGLAVTRRQLARLKDEGYLRADVQADELSEPELGNVVSFGLLLEYLDSTNPLARGGTAS